uniref:Uncharacterized protein n=1 Tax=viral metagenome TaxID=1070528 RepID=A0A6C0CL65_9ZZZZ
MGQTSSVEATNKVRRQIDSEVRNNATVASKQSVELGDVNISGRCKVGISQTSVIDADVMFKTTNKVLAEAIQNATSETKDGLEALVPFGGGSFKNSDTVSRNEFEEQLSTLIENQCANANEQIAVAKNVSCTDDGEFIIAQNSNQKLACKQETANDITSKLDQTATAKKTGFTLDFLTILIIVGAVIGLFVLYYVLGGDAETQ